jgi:hypothetical protein
MTSQPLPFIPEIFDTPLFTVAEPVKPSMVPLAEPREKNRLVFILENPQEEVCSAAEMDLLCKIADWKELKMKRTEAAVVNCARQPVVFTELLRSVRLKNVICFGVPPKNIGLQIEATDTGLISFRGIQFIFTSSLSTLNANNHLKQKFFREALRPMFP